MRVIGGRLKGRRFHPPKNLPVRPTTDFSKESLFNILENNFELAELKVLDLFAGTGSMSYEFASRGCENITAVDSNRNCVKFIEKTISEFDIENEIDVIFEDALGFVQNAHEKFDVIFADPPYQYPHLQVLTEAILNNNILSENGIFILEHPPNIFFDKHQRFVQQRKYGSSIFSFFK